MKIFTFERAPAVVADDGMIVDVRGCWGHRVVGVYPDGETAVVVRQRSWYADVPAAALAPVVLTLFALVLAWLG